MARCSVSPTTKQMKHAQRQKRASAWRGSGLSSLRLRRVQAMQSRRISGVCILGAGLLLLVGLFLWFDNPTVNVSASDLGDRGAAGEVGCSISPWDAGLNDNRDGPGGEHSGTYFNEVSAECYSANTTRFNAAVGSGVFALLLLGVGIAVAARSKQSRPTT